MSRQERRRAARAHTIVGWAEHASPKQLKHGDGWYGELDRAYRQGTDYVVLVRDVETEWGTIQHAVMRNTDNTDIPWAEKQRIKNELFGKEAVALEVFPAMSELIDAADMYHIWVLPADFKLPFTID